MPSAYGLYSGLTGARLDGADCRFLGLADYYIESDSKEDLVKALEQADWSGGRYKTVSGCWKSFQHAPECQNLKPLPVSCSSGNLKE